jgi:hypothetical protein
MRWILGLAGTGIDVQSIRSNIMEFDRPDCLDDIANLGSASRLDASNGLRRSSRRSLARKSTATRYSGRTAVSATGGAM